MNTSFIATGILNQVSQHHHPLSIMARWEFEFLQHRLPLALENPFLYMPSAAIPADGVGLDDAFVFLPVL